MSQEQPRRPRDNENQGQDLEREPITYGDVFPVTGGLADKPIAPQDAAMMQTAETTAFGEPQTGGPADLMVSAAAINERAGLVDSSDVTDMAREKGVTITGTDFPGGCLVTEKFAGQVHFPDFQRYKYRNLIFVLINHINLRGCFGGCWATCASGCSGDG